MLKCLVITGFMILFSLWSSAQDDSAAKARQIIGIEQTLMNALPGDTIPWNKYLAPNWYCTTEDGTGYFREAFLHSFSAFPSGFSGNIQVTKPVLVFHGNLAVIHYVADEHESVLGQQLHTTYGMANTWYKSDSSWVMLSALTFEIPQLLLSHPRKDVGPPAIYRYLPNDGGSPGGGQSAAGYALHPKRQESARGPTGGNGQCLLPDERYAWQATICPGRVGRYDHAGKAEWTGSGLEAGDRSLAI
ncbi:nuclear transport factor 2 family protein [Puia sp. P3]|uniref:nuclear transport factor 2 family protein n=1 Tax=Puia sp. P3 TaxID=3423952 RepID=UPI003D66874E